MKLIYFYLITCILLIYSDQGFSHDGYDDDVNSFFNNGNDLYGEHYSGNYDDHHQHPPPHNPDDGDQPPPPPPPRGPDDGQQQQPPPPPPGRSPPEKPQRPDRPEGDGDYRRPHNNHSHHHGYYDDLDRYDMEVRDLVFGGYHHYKPRYYEEGHGLKGEEAYGNTPKDPTKYDQYGNYLPDYLKQPQNTPPPIPVPSALQNGNGEEENDKPDDEEENESKPKKYVKYKKYKPSTKRVSIIESKSSVVYDSYGDDSSNSTDDYNNATFPQEFDAFSGKSYFSYEDTKDPFNEVNVTNDYYFDNKSREIYSDDNGWYNYDFNDESNVSDGNDIFDEKNENDRYYDSDYYSGRDRDEIWHEQYELERQQTNETNYTTHSPSGKAE
ncbi:unnamed protein product [Schistosoma intercalatum]|nr:unnamed protein product [Schistosoma intercalatum]